MPDGTVRQAHKACEEGIFRHGPTAHDEAPQAEEIPVANGVDGASAAEALVAVWETRVLFTGKL